MAQYVYSVANDTLNGMASPDTLDYKIQQGGITIARNGITVDGDSITFDFKTDISAAEKTELDSIVANHNGMPLEIYLWHEENGLL